MLATADFQGASNSMPARIEAALSEPLVKDLIIVAGKSSVVRFVEYQLIKLTQLISVGNSLNDTQIQFIAIQFVDLFPNETLVDFKLCFERGCAGQYGDIFRMDGIVLRKWMERYLEEKYQVVEEELKKDKTIEYQQFKSKDPEKDWLKIWQEAIAKGPEEKEAPLFADEVNKAGKEVQKRRPLTSGYKYFPVRNVQVFAYSQEHAEQLIASMIKSGELIEDPTIKPKTSNENIDDHNP